MAVMGLTDTKM